MTGGKMPAKTVSVQLNERTLKRLEDTCEHYRWKRSQSVIEYIDFYHRLQEYLEDYKVGVDEHGREFLYVTFPDGEPVFLEDLNAEMVLMNLVRSARSGLLAAFRAPAEFEQLLTDEDEDNE
jgi:hypothetical protein